MDRRDQDLSRALRRVEHRLRLVLDLAADIVVLAGPDGELRDAEDRPAALDLVHPDDTERVRAVLARTRTSRERAPAFTCRLRAEDGSYREMAGTATNLLDDPDVEAVVLTLRDVTERRVLERSFLHLHRLTTVLAQTNEAALRATDRGELLGEACRIAVEVGGLRIAWAAEREGGTDVFVPRTAAGLDLDRLRERGEDHDGPLGPGSPARRAIDRGEAVVVPVAEAFGAGSSCHLPLVVDGTVTGVLALYADRSGFFDDAATSVLQRLAGNVSFGLAVLGPAGRAADGAALAVRRRASLGSEDAGADDRFGFHEHTLDAATGLLTRVTFRRCVSDLRHGTDGRFAVLAIAFATEPEAQVGARLRSVLRAGDVAARWSGTDLTVLRHPILSAADAEELERVACDALAVLDATGVAVLVSSEDDDRPMALLARAVSDARRASGSAVPDGDGPRRASPVVV